MVKIGLIGLGKWGKNHLRSLSKIDCNLIGFSDIDIGKKDLADEYGVEFFSDYKELLKKVDAVSECEGFEELISQQSAYFDEIRESAQANKDKLGGQVVFPETPKFHCPSMENWQQWHVSDAWAISRFFKTFLETFNQKIDELNNLVDEYNERRERNEL